MTQPASLTGNEHGFTLIELLLSIALITIITGMSSAVFFGIQYKNGLDLAATTLAQTLRQAQTLAQNGSDDSGWGVRVQSGNVILFKGSTYATRDQAADVTATVASNVTFAGASETDFAKFTGDPAAIATYTLSSNNSSKAVTVNSKGMVGL